MSTARFNTLQNAAGSKSVPVDTVVDGSAKAWVNFNGTGTVAIRASFNVSSITDNGVGIYTVNFTNAMPDTNYGFSGTAEQQTTGSTGAWMTFVKYSGGAQTTTALQVATLNVSTYADGPLVAVAIFR